LQRLRPEELDRVAGDHARTGPAPGARSGGGERRPDESGGRERERRRRRRRERGERGEAEQRGAVLPRGARSSPSRPAQDGGRGRLGAETAPGAGPAAVPGREGARGPGTPARGARAAGARRAPPRCPAARAARRPDPGRAGRGWRAALALAPPGRTHGDDLRGAREEARGDGLASRQDARAGAEATRGGARARTRQRTPRLGAQRGRVLWFARHLVRGCRRPDAHALGARLQGHEPGHTLHAALRRAGRTRERGRGRRAPAPRGRALRRPQHDRGLVPERARLRRAAALQHPLLDRLDPRLRGPDARARRLAPRAHRLLRSMSTLASELRALVGPAGVIEEPTRLLPYESDALAMLAVRPELVVLPRDTRETAAAMRLLAARGMAVVPRGAGTGLAGGATP